MASASALASDAIGAISLIFYALLIGFLLRHRKEFNSSFYKMFISLSLANMFQRIITGFFLLFPYDGFFPALFASNFDGFLPVFAYFLNHWAGVSQAFGHLVMAINRWSAMKYPFEYESLWTIRRLFIAIGGQWLVSMIIAVYLLFAPSEYDPVGVDSFFLNIASTSYYKASFGVNFTIVIGVTLITLVMNMFAIYYYIQQRSTTNIQKKIKSSDLRWFIFSIAIFVIYCLESAYQLVGLIEFVNPTISVPIIVETFRWINEITCDADPYLLMLTSSSLRNRLTNIVFGGNCCTQPQQHQQPNHIVLPANSINTGGKFVSTNNSRPPAM